MPDDTPQEVTSLSALIGRVEEYETRARLMTIGATAVSATLLHDIAHALNMLRQAWIADPDFMRRHTQ